MLRARALLAGGLAASSKCVTELGYRIACLEDAAQLSDVVACLRKCCARVS
jgi:hypothetical protein